MQSLIRAILKDKKVLRELGILVIDAGGYRLPEEALIGGLLEVVQAHDLCDRDRVTKWRQEHTSPPQESPLEQVKKTLHRDSKVSQGFGALVVHAGGYRLLPDDLTVGLRYIVATFDRDQQQREAWHEAGGRFLQLHRKPRRPRKPSAPETETTRENDGESKSA